MNMGLVVHEVTEVSWDVQEKSRVLVVKTHDGSEIRIAMFPKDKTGWHRHRLEPKVDTYA